MNIKMEDVIDRINKNVVELANTLRSISMSSKNEIKEFYYFSSVNLNLMNVIINMIEETYNDGLIKNNEVHVKMIESKYLINGININVDSPENLLESKREILKYRNDLVLVFNMLDDVDKLFFEISMERRLFLDKILNSKLDIIKEFANYYRNMIQNSSINNKVRQEYNRVYELYTSLYSRFLDLGNWSENFSDSMLDEIYEMLVVVEFYFKEKEYIEGEKLLKHIEIISEYFYTILNEEKKDLIILDENDDESTTATYNKASEELEEAKELLNKKINEFENHYREIVNKKIKNNNLQFEEAQEKYKSINEKYEKDILDLYIEKRDQIDEISSTKIDEINELVKTVAELVALIGQRSTTVGYGEFANESKELYKKYSKYAIWGFAAIIGATGYLLYSIKDAKTIDTGIAIIRIGILTVLTAPVTYFIKEASKHHRLSNLYRKMELDLRTVDSYMKRVKDANDDDEIKKIKLQLGERLFGRLDVIDDNKGKKSHEEDVNLSFSSSFANELLKVLQKKTG